MSEIRKSISVTSKLLTDTQIKAAPGTLIEIVPSFGANFIIMPLQVHVHLLSTGAYTNFDAVASFGLQRGTAGGKIFNMDQFDTLLGSAVNIDANMIEQQVFDLPTDISNKPLNLAIVNALGAFTGGAAANQLSITVSYWVKHV